MNLDIVEKFGAPISFAPRAAAQLAPALVRSWRDLQNKVWNRPINESLIENHVIRNPDNEILPSPLNKIQFPNRTKLVSRLRRLSSLWNNFLV